METHYSEWACYITGALLTLAAKLGRSVYWEVKQGKPLKTAILEYFFEKTDANLASWAGTIGIVWACGTIYIDRVGFPSMESFASIPVVNSFAFMLGFAAEMAVPGMAKWIVRKFPGQET